MTGTHHTVQFVILWTLSIETFPQIARSLSPNNMVQPCCSTPQNQRRAHRACSDWRATVTVHSPQVLPKKFKWLCPSGFILSPRLDPSTTFKTRAISFWEVASPQHLQRNEDSCKGYVPWIQKLALQISFVLFVPLRWFARVVTSAVNWFSNAFFRSSIAPFSSALTPSTKSGIRVYPCKEQRRDNT